MKKDRTSLISFFAALCFFLSAVEYAIPKPLPFLRLGLANLPILLSIYKMKRRDTILLVLIKVIGQGFISGTLFSYIFVFSAAGSFSSALIMILLWSLLKNTGTIGTLGLSIAGALANNCAQLAVSRFMLFGANTKYIAPILLITGLVTGTALGFFADLFIQKSRWFASISTTGETLK